MKNVDNYILEKVEEILNSPSYASLSDEEKEQMRLKIESHLEKLVLETFVNRLSEYEAKKLNNLLKESPEEAYQKLGEFTTSDPELADDLEKRLTREVDRFKSLGTN